MVGIIRQYIRIFLWLWRLARYFSYSMKHLGGLGTIVFLGLEDGMAHDRLEIKHIKERIGRRN